MTSSIQPSTTKPIPRFQRILYWSLVCGIALMFALLIRGCVHQQARILAMRDQSPIPAPNDVPDEQASIAQPNETDGSVSLDSISLPLPEEPSLRAKAILIRMLSDLAQPASLHPVPTGPSVTDVFLLSLPLGNPDGVSLPSGGGQLAVVNLAKAFADAHLFRHRDRRSHPPRHRRHPPRQLPPHPASPLPRRRHGPRHPQRPRRPEPRLLHQQPYRFHPRRRHRWRADLLMSAPPTIAVFDSGFGGLTVLRELLPLIPGARYLYLGDTARLPYGAKSQTTIARYALSSAAFLLAEGAEMLVVACNTASALALDELQSALPIPVVGVIEPGTQAASIASQGSTPVLVLATAATVASRAYARSCAALGLHAFEKACPLLVPLVEEGWIDHPVTAEVVRIYLAEALEAAPEVRTLVLGCTHYPLLKLVIARVLADLGHPMHIVDSVAATARAAAGLLSITPNPKPVTCRFFATDSIEKFSRLGANFLGQPLDRVTLVDLGD